MTTYLQVEKDDDRVCKYRKSQLKTLHDCVIRCRESAKAAEAVCEKAAQCFRQEKETLNEMAIVFGEAIMDAPFSRR